MVGIKIDSQLTMRFCQPNQKTSRQNVWAPCCWNWNSIATVLGLGVPVNCCKIPELTFYSYAIIFVFSTFKTPPLVVWKVKALTWLTVIWWMVTQMVGGWWWWWWWRWVWRWCWSWCCCWWFDKVRSGTMPRSRVEQQCDDHDASGPGISKKLGGVAYKPGFLLDSPFLR